MLATHGTEAAIASCSLNRLPDDEPPRRAVPEGGPSDLKGSTTVERVLPFFLFWMHRPNRGDEVRLHDAADGRNLFQDRIACLVIALAVELGDDLLFVQNEHVANLQSASCRAVR